VVDDRRTTVLTAAIITVGAFLFYLATLAPTVLWGDDAFFQWSAASGYLQADGGGHWLHFKLARLFVQLPVGDTAYRVNMVSAVFGALTLLFLFLTGKSLNLSNLGAVAAALSLAVAHTFWTHAVRAEVYTVFTCMLALIFWLAASWSKERPIFLYAAVFLTGPTLLSHQLGLLLLPVLLLLVWLRRDWVKDNDWLMGLAAFVTGNILALVIIHNQVGGENFIDSLAIFFTQSGTDFQGAIFDFSFGQLPGDIAYWVGMLGLQFVGPAFLLGCLGFYYWRKERALWLPLLIFYLLSVLFAATYRVNDRYVFFLPGYLIFAWMVGKGWDMVQEKRPRTAKMILPLLILAPILTYGLLPPVMEVAGMSVPGARTLPGREPVSYFLWPAKTGYQSAAEFGRSALTDLPPNSVLIADHTPYETLYYLQKVESVRPDVQLIKVEPDENLATVIDAFQGDVPVFLADNNRNYYYLDSLPGTILVRDGIVYRLEHE
jgi:hypothetical protein